MYFYSSTNDDNKGLWPCSLAPWLEHIIATAVQLDFFPGGIPCIAQKLS